MPDSFERREWELEVEAKTRHGRIQRAGRFQRMAARAAAEGRGKRALWYGSRARGQLRRFDQVWDCGGTQLLVSCEDCGHEVKRVEARCGHFRICLSCRGACSAERRFRFREGREHALKRTEMLRRFGGKAGGGRWSEKFLTLTLPHSGDIERDIKSLPRAWRKFRKLLYDFFRLDLGMPESEVDKVAWVRVLEVTAGHDGLGHAHLHAYLLCPFLPIEWLTHLWGRALASLGYGVPKESLADVLECADEARRPQLRSLFVTRRGRQGRPLQEVCCPIVHVERCYGDIENELVKYLVKDLDRDANGNASYVDPTLFARIYDALEGVRTVQTSAGFWRKHTARCRCTQCGSEHTVRERVRTPTATPKPGQAGE